MEYGYWPSLARIDDRSPSRAIRRVDSARAHALLAYMRGSVDFRETLNE